MYFGCALFSVDLKIKQGEFLNNKVRQYCETMHGKFDEDIIKKETKRLKSQVWLYRFYKQAQLGLFMHFHQVTIVVTLLLAVLARSLFSFGYILVCMTMVY